MSIVANNGAAGPWSRVRSKIPIALRAIVTGLAIGMIAANVWPLLLLNLGAPIASVLELIFLGAYLWWVAGGGAPLSWRAARAEAFRATTLSPDQWVWGLVAAVFFAATVHSSIVLLFRFVPFPLAAFRQGYDFSFIPTVSLRWLAVVVSAMSAGVCEEVGFRGYMQRPIELRHGAPVAILISSLFFMALHLTKAWALLGMVPIVFGAGVLLGLLARSAGSLIPCIIGHTTMDIGLFAYWWTGIAGDFPERPLSETGLDTAFCVACGVFVFSLSLVLLTISRLQRISGAADLRAVQSV
jgi:membrane protease YdiL (CAAX protease family)